MLVKPTAGQAANIKVVGAGGGGGNAITSMVAEGGIPGVEFVAINTDAQALLNNKAEVKVQIGEVLTKGLGSGGDPEIGRQAAEESRENIKEEIDGADMVFITSGMGGGTGTGSASVIAEISKEVGALTVAVVTKPFSFEGTKRFSAAEEGIAQLKEKVDTLIVVPNQRVLQVIDKKASILDAFRRIDSVLYQGVRGIAELITLPGLINVDFADVKTIMNDSGTALMGIGLASGDKRAISAIKQAISSPLLDASIEGAKGILFNVVGGADMGMNEIDEAASIIQKTVDSDADIIFGAAIDESMSDQIKITVVATRFDESSVSRFRFQTRNRPSSFSSSSSDNSSGAADKTEDKDEVTESLYEPEEQEVKKTSQSQRADVFVEDDDEFDVPAFLRKK